MSKQPEKASLAPVPAPSEPTALAAAEPTADQMMAAIMSGQGGVDTGFGDMRSQDFVMPMLKLLQASSPEVKPSNAKYMPAAKIGQFLDTSNGELMDKAEIIPCLFQARMVEWKVDEKGQIISFVAVHASDFGTTLPTDDRGRKIMPSGTRLVDTRYHYVLRLRGTGAAMELIPNIIALSSSGLKISKDWNSKMDNLRIPPIDAQGNAIPNVPQIKPPVFMNVCQVGPSTDEHKGNNDWKGWKVTLLRLINTKESEMLKKAYQTRVQFQESSANMKPVAETEPEYVPAAGKDENKHL